MLERRRRQVLPQVLAKAEMKDLLLARRHSAAVALERSSLIISRTQLAARLFAVLTVSWIVVDTLTMTWPLWGVLAVDRLLAAAGFAVLARHRFEVETVSAARRAVAALVGTAIAFFLSASIMFWAFPSDEQSIFATTTYFYAPFLIAAGLSLFPLTILESLALAVPVSGAMALSILLLPELLGTISAPATLWRLFLMSTIGGIAGVSQLRFLIKLTEQSSSDKLTGALNRRFGEQALELQFATAARDRQPLSLLFIDLDRFKSVNDRFGHEWGDTLLYRVACSLRSNLRREDLVIRWGGEEFLVVLPNTDSASAEVAIARIAGAGLGLRPDGTPQTASIGIAERMRDGAPDRTALVDCADKRMYAAKHAGRNCHVGASGRAVPFIAGRAAYEPNMGKSQPDAVATHDGALLENAVGAD